MSNPQPLITEPDDEAQPLITEPDEERARIIEELTDYESALDRYANLDAISKLDPVIHETKTKLDRIQMLLANASDAGISVEKESDLREEYARLKKKFCWQTYFVCKHRQEFHNLGARLAGSFAEKGLIDDKLTAPMGSAISAVAFAFTQYMLNKCDAQ